METNFAGGRRPKAMALTSHVVSNGVAVVGQHLLPRGRHRSLANQPSSYNFNVAQAEREERR